MVLTHLIARTSAPYDAFKGGLLVLGVTDASGNVVVEYRRSLGWGLGYGEGEAIFGCRVV
ncbi:hypothetical protein BJ165DRAFT_1501403, partial [Panaeolus papilionaceus]